MGASTHSWPPGFRFRPTDRELVAHYLTRKVLGRNIEEGIIAEIDLYKCEPWDLPDKSYFGSRDDEWYFFSARDRKYPNGSRTNRATEAGYWKATGKDRTVRTGSKTAVGMKKTLVFYMGRAPHGKRTDWIMHEYRLEDGEGRQFVAPQDTFVLCRVFKKGAPKNEDEGPLVEDESAQGQDSSAGLTQDSPKLTVGIVARVSTASGKVETTPLLMPKEELPCCVQNSQSSPTIEDKEESSGDSLDAFLSMLLDDVPKPSQEQHIPMADAPVQENENWSGETSAEFMDAVLSAFGNEDDAVAQQGKLNFEDDLNIIDLLEGNFFELNDLQNLDGNARNGENYTDFPTEPERYQYQNSGMQLFSSDIYGGESTHNQTDQTQNKMYTAPQLPHGGRRDKNLISMIDAKFPSGEDITDSSVISTPGSCTFDDYSSMVSTDARIVPPADAWEVDFSDPLLYFNDMEASATSLYAEGPSVLNDRNEETYFEPLGEALPSEEPKPSMVDTSQASVSTSVSTVQSSHQTNSRQKPLGKFLSLLGSVQVLPASAAEFPADFSKSNSLVKGVTVSSSGSKGQTIQVASMNVCVAAVTVTCTEKPKELSGQITDCPKEQKMLCTTCGMKERSRSEKVKQNGARVKQTGVRVMNGVSYFIFLLGSVSALFWILFFHGISKLSSYICGVLS